MKNSKGVNNNSNNNNNNSNNNTRIGLWHTHGSPILCQKTRPYTNQQKRELAKLLTLLSRLIIKFKLKECEKKDKYLDLAREVKESVVPIVIGAFGTVIEGLLKGLEDLEVGGRVETIQTTASLKTARIPRRVLETWWDLMSLRLQWKTIS